jgi:hypothetical protein
MIGASLPRNDALRSLVDEYRGRCLWFLQQGYYPDTTTEAMRVLDSIQSHGDLRAFRQAGELKQWVLANSSGRSAGS